MSDHYPTIENVGMPLQRPPLFGGNAAMLMSMFLILPLVGAVIFCAGLWFGQQWTHLPFIAAEKPDVSLEGAPETPARSPVLAALQRPIPGPSPNLTTQHRTGSGSRDTASMTTSSPLPSDLWSARLEPDAEGWRIVKDSQASGDLADFIDVFPTSPFAAVARKRLHQLLAQSSDASLDDLLDLAPLHIANTKGGPSYAPPSITPLQVRYAQARLHQASFHPGPVDGILGQRTHAALRQYQASRNLPVTGTLDAITQGSLAIPPHATLEAYQQSFRRVSTPLKTPEQLRQGNNKTGNE